MSWRNFVPNFVTHKWDSWFRKVENALVYFTPKYVAKKNTFFSPVIAVVALILAILFLGLAIGAFFVFFSSLLVLYFIITKVFGIQLDLNEVVKV